MTQLPEGMFRQTSPCIDCPFRKEGGVRHSQEMMASYISYFVSSPGATFPCHRSVPKDDPRTKWSAWREGQTVCAGGLIFAKKLGIEGATVRLGLLHGGYDPAQMTDEDQVFDSVSEMLAVSKEEEDARNQ